MTNTIPLAVDIVTGSPLVRVGAGGTWAWRGRLDGDTKLSAPMQGGRPRPIPLGYDVAPAAVAPGSQVDPWAVLPPGLPPAPSTPSTPSTPSEVGGGR